MADLIKIDVTGDRSAGVRFAEFPDDLREELLKEINSLANELLARVEAKTPDKTGKLRSLERAKVYNDPNRVVGVVDVATADVSEIRKAAALEYGSRHQAVGVKSHSMRLDHHWSEKLAAPEQVLVQAYNRTPNIAEVAFERGPLAEMAPEIVARINAAVEKAVAKANA